MENTNAATKPQTPHPKTRIPHPTPHTPRPTPATRTRNRDSLNPKQVTRAMEDKNVDDQLHDLLHDFLCLASNCKAVICCRVSPDQKRQIVAMVKTNTKPEPMTL